MPQLSKKQNAFIVATVFSTIAGLGVPAVEAQCGGASPVTPVTTSPESNNIPGSAQIVNGTNTHVNLTVPNQVSLIALGPAAMILSTYSGGGAYTPSANTYTIITNATQVNLPGSGTVPAGSTILLTIGGSQGALSVMAASGDNIVFNASTTNTSVNLRNGDQITLLNQGNGVWLVQAFLPQGGASGSTWSATQGGTGLTSSGTDTTKALMSNGSGGFVMATPAGGGGSPGGTPGQVQYNNSGAFGGFTVSGDATLNSGTGQLTVSTGAISNSKMAAMNNNTVKGNVSGTVTAPTDLTPAQLTSLINTFTTSLSGSAPPSGGGTSNFLRADGTWAVPAGASGSPNYFGSGADGAATISTNTQLGTAGNHTSFLVKNYSSLTINSGTTLSLAGQYQATLIYCTGACDIEGTLTVSGNGASATASEIDLYKYAVTRKQTFPSETANQSVTMQTTKYPTLAAGAAGGAAASGTGNPGSAGAAHQTGGGGSGAGNPAGPTGSGGAGAAGTAYSGGSAGGGGGYNGTTQNGGAGAINGGAGGSGGSTSGVAQCSGGGAGNPPGTGSAGTTGGTVANADGGGGGTLYLVVGGNLTIGTNGVISADGAAGGTVNGTTAYTLPGGGAGGGRIVILYAGSLTNSGSIHANGGASGTAYGGAAAAGAGGAGTITGPNQIGGS